MTRLQAAFREALNSVCAKRGIDLTNVNVYLDSYKTPLPVLTTETSWLGGKHILIKDTRKYRPLQPSLHTLSSSLTPVRKATRGFCQFYGKVIDTRKYRPLQPSLHTLSSSLTQVRKATRGLCQF
ncbi:Pleckstrin y domain containing, G (with RhoGef domain) member [Homalodisca vitripennis]|nr:Pleckstrin y domain containing, G (with RhoGef domain) member [Homalodisca vitripennis]